MCGITGIWRFKDFKISLEEIGNFTDQIAHRGPDGYGYHLDESNNLALGHRRLSILDLSKNGNQPMYDATNRYCIVYNGEIFNFLEIKTKLELNGIKLHTSTDTEIVLQAYILWGADCLSMFNGMWALAIWDKADNELFLARDRFGVKPLYYHSSSSVFAFSSETISFKKLLGFDRCVDELNYELNVIDNLCLEGVGKTIFQNIVQLLPGHFIRLKRGSAVEQKRWWHIHDNLVEVPKTFEEQTMQFNQLLHDSCKRRLVSDVPIGTALSGGLDSSSVYSVVKSILTKEENARVHPDSQRAFIASFPELPSDELDYANQVVNFVNGSSVVIRTNPAELSQQIETDTIKSDYVNSWPITPISQIYRSMKNNGVSVSLDGHGVDEMMYGYVDMNFSLYQSALYNNGIKAAKPFREVLEKLTHPDNIVKYRQYLDQLEFGSKMRGLRLTRNQILSNLGIPRFNQDYLQKVPTDLSNNPYNFNQYPTHNRMLYFDFFVHQLPSLLRNFDRAGMMNSVEIRMPFLDWELVSYVFSLPFESKVGNGFTKRILREAMKDKLPESIRTRTYKVGVGDPLVTWVKLYINEWFCDMLQTIKTTKAAGSLKIVRDNRNAKLTSDEFSAIHTGWLEINRYLIES